MANYYATVRTNYFTVKDEGRFREIIAALITEGDVLLFEQKTEDGTKFGFGCYGHIYGLADPNHEDAEPLDLAAALQTVVSPNDAVIIMEAGHEKLRYVSGLCTVITSKAIRMIDMCQQAIALSRKMLGDPNYNTKTYY